MSSFSDYTENNVLDHVFHNVNSFTKPADVYMSLHTTPGPTDAASANEITGVGNYARQLVPFATAASGGSIANTTAVSWTASGANYGDIVAVGFHDASTAGNFLAWDGITSATVNIGDTLNFAIGAITITLD